MAKKKVKCPICGHLLGNPNDPRHVRSPKHQEALKQQKSKQKLLIPSQEFETPTIKSEQLLQYGTANNKIIILESRIKDLEYKFNELISPYKKIKLKDFKRQLFKEYVHLNPSNDISGVDFEVLKRRICRELEISKGYFEDLIYDLQRNERIITIQAGRGKKYIQIKQISE